MWFFERVYPVHRNINDTPLAQIFRKHLSYWEGAFYTNQFRVLTPPPFGSPPTPYPLLFAPALAIYIKKILKKF